MTSPYLNNPRSAEDARLDLRAKRYERMLDQLRAEEAGNLPVARAIEREIEAIDRRLRVLEGEA